MYQRLIVAVLLLHLGIASAQPAAPTDTFMIKRYEVTVERDVVYGEGGVGGPEQARTRPLLLDIYQPAGAGDTPAPALLLAFGGAFHRSSRAPLAYVEDGAQNTPVAEYCHEFARRGYTCFVIDYRLVPEDPVIATQLGNPQGKPPKGHLRCCACSKYAQYYFANAPSI